MPSQLERAAARFRRELLNNERAAASALVRAYGAAWGAVSQDVARLQRQIAEARARGEDVSPAWFFQLRRAESLQAQVESQLRAFGRTATELTTGTQALAVQAAGRHSAELVDLAAGVRPTGIEVPFDVLPTSALSDLVGFAADGSPLRDVYADIAGGVADRVTDAMATALAGGWGPRETARYLRRQFGAGLVRALLVSRTETLRAYREAAHRNYENNRDVLEGWVWHATLTTRTCAACWAMHGSFHELKERLDDHPNGRCTPVPQVKPWRALGYDIPDRRPVIEPGEQAFAKLTAAEQEQVLGKAAFAAWSDGAVSLSQFAAHKHSDEWGDTVGVASLRSLLGANKAKDYVRAIRTKIPVSVAPKPLYDLSEGTRLRGELVTETTQLVGEEIVARRQIRELTRKIEWQQKFFDERYEKAKAANDPAGMQASIDAALIANKPLQTERSGLYTRLDEVKQKRATATTRILGLPADKRSGVSVDLGAFKGKRGVNELRARTDEAVDFVNRITAGSKVSIWTRINKKPRASANRGYINMNVKTPIQTIVHEIGHNIEFERGPIYRAKRMAFFDSRTQGDKLEKLKDLTGFDTYDDDEVAKRDKWPHVYMGRVYSFDSDTDPSSEIISMGIDRLYYDARGLADEDPEYFDFIVSYLRGTL